MIKIKNTKPKKTPGTYHAGSQKKPIHKQTATIIIKVIPMKRKLLPIKVIEVYPSFIYFLPNCNYSLQYNIQNVYVKRSLNMQFKIITIP